MKVWALFRDVNAQDWDQHETLIFRSFESVLQYLATQYPKVAIDPAPYRDDLARVETNTFLGWFWLERVNEESLGGHGRLIA